MDDKSPRHPLEKDKVETARAESLLGEQALGLMAQLFSLLSDPLRIQICATLAHVGELCVTDIALAIGVDENRVSYALRQLRQAGAVNNRRVGREVFYTLSDERLQNLLHSARHDQG